MLQSPTKKSVLQKQIPTLVGLFVLVIALVGGVLMIGSGAGVFAPRASAETTPRNIRVSNVTDSSFTISFLTDIDTTGFVKYGTTADKLTSQSSDDRDQLTGTVGSYQTHHITVRGLNPNTEYFYVLGTGGQATFDNEGSSFSIKTAQRTGTPSAAKTAYGTVLNASGQPADGAIVYVTLPGVGEMSSLVKATGSWAIPLSNARLADGTGYAEITDESMLSIFVQGASQALSAQTTATVAQSQPVEAITLAGRSDNLAMEQDSSNRLTDLRNPGFGDPVQPEMQAMGEGTLDGNSTTQSNDSMMNANSTVTGTNLENGLGGLNTMDQMDSMDAMGSENVASSSSQTDSSSLDALLTPANLTPVASAAAATVTTTTVIDFNDSETKPVSSTKNPVIRGTVKPNVTVKLVVNSDTQITQELTTNASGEFELDIAALSEELEPGEHTATYSYVDPDTGQEVTKTVTFTVADPDAASSAYSTSTGTGGTGDNPESQLLAQATTPTPSPRPFSSSNPYPIGSPSASATPSATATPSASAGKGGTTSALPSTTSAIPVSGSVGTTFALVLGGLFFIVAGVWSFWLAHEIDHA